ncbi:MAG TPA: metallophosphoesterase [Candidatus Caenarcaniphilales bacterium]|nr:metallophosphoesterase [Candidatus Caenarcaniphilales bacterium]
MSTTVVLLGDTHLPRFGRRLPEPLVAGLGGAELIMHVGDITEPFVLDLLGEFAPVEAVAGNNDPPELADRLGFTRFLAVEGMRVGMTHGHLGPGRTTPDRARRLLEAADPHVDAICFGHSHQPMVERRDGIWLLNPGSPTDRRRERSFSYLRLEVDGRDLRPELIRYGAWR